MECGVCFRVALSMSLGKASNDDEQCERPKYYLCNQLITEGLFEKSVENLETVRSIPISWVYDLLATLEALLLHLNATTSRRFHIIKCCTSPHVPRHNSTQCAIWNSSSPCNPDTRCLSTSRKPTNTLPGEQAGRTACKMPSDDKTCGHITTNQGVSTDGPGENRLLESGTR